MNRADWIFDHKEYYTRDYTCFYMPLKGNLIKCLSKQKNIEKEFQRKMKHRVYVQCIFALCHTFLR
jgi:hypothetical protein